MKTIMWKGIEIPDKDCFKKGKKCTPECSSYDLVNLHLPDENVDGGTNMKTLNYDKYTKLMISEGWKSTRKIFTEKDLDIKVFSREMKTYDYVIILQCPSENMMSLCGINYLSKDDNNKAFTIKLKLFSKNGTEIPSDTKIRINKESDNGIIQYEVIKYGDIKIPYEFKHTIELGRFYYDSLRIYTVNCDSDIDKDKTKVNIEVDVWSRM